MDIGFSLIQTEVFTSKAGVLILILMDIGFSQLIRETERAEKERVLILILMDIGFSHELLH